MIILGDVIFELVSSRSAVLSWKTSGYIAGWNEHVTCPCYHRILCMRVRRFHSHHALLLSIFVHSFPQPIP